MVGKKLKVLEQNSLKECGYDDFYKDSKLEKKYACCQKYNSKYEELVWKEFTVVSYEKHIQIIGSLVDTLFKLKLSNDTTSIIYFKYNPKYEHSFVFKVLGGLDFPIDFFCKFITKDVDKFTKKNHI